jgi:hypothetical protein
MRHITGLRGYQTNMWVLLCMLQVDGVGDPWVHWYTPSQWRRSSPAHLEPNTSSIMQELAWASQKCTAIQPSWTHVDSHVSTVLCCCAFKSILHNKNSTIQETWDGVEYPCLPTAFFFILHTSWILMLTCCREVQRSSITVRHLITVINSSPLRPLRTRCKWLHTLQKFWNNSYV